MLNIPSSVKALFQADGVHKNFRVHFPNGEMADITNDNVVQESVKFTESLCSQSTFKFGLAEASVLEFETVGIGNMYGMTIQASCEIDCSSLSVADKATIAAGTWDGTWDSVNEVFAVPYGTFRVDSCPRDHQSMAHRQVTAYDSTLFNIISPVETLKLKVGSKDGKEYKTSSQNLFFSLVNDKNVMLANGYTRTQITPVMVSYIPTGTGSSSYVPVLDTQPSRQHMTGDWYSIRVEFGRTLNRFSAGKTTAPPIMRGFDVPKDALFSLELGQGYFTWFDMAIQFIESSLQIDYDKIHEFGFATLKDYIANDLANIADWADPEMIFAPMTYVIAGETHAADISRLKITGNVDVFYPYLNDSQYMTISIPDEIRIREYGSQSTLVGSETYNMTALYGSTFKFYEYQTATVGTGISIAATGDRKYELNGVTYTINTFINSYEPIKVAQGFLEILAQFGKSNRLGGMDFVLLDNSNPLSIIPSNYNECWWDEFDVDSIGTVTIIFKDKDENGNDKENTTDINIGTGQSKYIMTENEMLKALTNSDLQSVTNIITNLFAPNLGAVNFTPIELSMQGWPWLEAGDALEIEAEDGTTVETYALRIEMNGIQNLQAVITAEGGEIIEEVD